MLNHATQSGKHSLADSELIEIWYRQSLDHDNRGPFYRLTIVGARLAHEFLYPAPRGISGAEQTQ